MKTLVTVMFNGANSDHVFDMPLDKFNAMWNLAIAENGYFRSQDEHGVQVYINPQQCPVIEIRKWEY